MDSEKLKENFLAYVQDHFDVIPKLDKFELACLTESTSLVLKTTENNLPITLTLSYPDLMKFVFQQWKGTVESWFSAYPVNVPTNTQFRGVNIPVDHSSREQTKLLFDRLNSQFEG